MSQHIEKWFTYSGCLIVWVHIELVFNSTFDDRVAPQIHYQFSYNLWI